MSGLTWHDQRDFRTIGAMYGGGQFSPSVHAEQVSPAHPLLPVALRSNDELTVVVHRQTVLPSASQFVIVRSDIAALDRIKASFVKEEATRNPLVAKHPIRLYSEHLSDQIRSTSDLERAAVKSVGGPIHLFYRVDKGRENDVAAVASSIESLPAAPLSRRQLRLEASAAFTRQKSALIASELAAAKSSATSAPVDWKQQVCDNISAHLNKNAAADESDLVCHAVDQLMTHVKHWEPSNMNNHLMTETPTFVASLVASELINSVRDLHQKRVEGESDRDRRRAYSGHMERSPAWHRLERMRRYDSQFVHDRRHHRHGHRHVRPYEIYPPSLVIHAGREAVPSDAPARSIFKEYVSGSSVESKEERRRNGHVRPRASGQKRTEDVQQVAARSGSKSHLPAGIKAPNVPEKASAKSTQRGPRRGGEDEGVISDGDGHIGRNIGNHRTICQKKKEENKKSDSESDSDGDNNGWSRIEKSMGKKSSGGSNNFAGPGHPQHRDSTGTYAKAGGEMSSDDDDDSSTSDSSGDEGANGWERMGKSAGGRGKGSGNNNFAGPGHPQHRSNGTYAKAGAEMNAPSAAAQAAATPFATVTPKPGAWAYLEAARAAGSGATKAVPKQTPATAKKSADVSRPNQMPASVPAPSAKNASAAAVSPPAATAKKVRTGVPIESRTMPASVPSKPAAASPKNAATAPAKATTPAPKTASAAAPAAVEKVAAIPGFAKSGEIRLRISNRASIKTNGAVTTATLRVYALENTEGRDFSDKIRSPSDAIASVPSGAVRNITVPLGKEYTFVFVDQDRGNTLSVHRLVDPKAGDYMITIHGSQAENPADKITLRSESLSALAKRKTAKLHTRLPAHMGATIVLSNTNDGEFPREIRLGAEFTEVPVGIHSMRYTYLDGSKAPINAPNTALLHEDSEYTAGNIAARVSVMLDEDYGRAKLAEFAPGVRPIANSIVFYNPRSAGVEHAPIAQLYPRQPSNPSAFLDDDYTVTTNAGTLYSINASHAHVYDHRNADVPIKAIFTHPDDHSSTVIVVASSEMPKAAQQ